MVPKKTTKSSGLTLVNKKRSSSNKNIVKELPDETPLNAESEVEEEQQDEEDEDDEDQEDTDDDDEEDDDEGEEEEEEEEEEEDVDPQSEEEEDMETVGFGDAMSKILQQNVAEDAQPILAKRTTARMRAILTEKKETKTAKLSASERRQREQKDMVIPDHTTLVKDRQLRMIATKGVVALFNAIEKHQHQSGKTAGTTGDKKDNVQVKSLSKESFLGLLKGATATTSSTSPTTKPSTSTTESSEWSVTKDDFMMGAKLKDWDATAKGQGKAGKTVEEEEEEAEAAWNQAADFDSDEDSKGSTKKRVRTSLKAKKANSTNKKLKN